MVAFHLTIWYYPVFNSEGSAMDRAWTVGNQVLTTLRMPLLLAVSGMLAAGKIGEGIGSARIRLSVATNYYLYAVWLAIYALAWIPVTFEQMPDKVSSPGSFIAQLIAPDTPLWFIFALAIYIPIFSLIGRWPRSVVLSGLTVLSVVVGLLPATEPQWWKILEFAIYFALGLYLKDRVIGGAASRPWLWLLAGIGVVIVATAAAAALEHEIAKSGTFLVRSVGTAAGALGAIVLACRIYPVRTALCWLGRRTLGIYVVHPLLITLLVVFVHPFDTSPWAAVVFTVALIPVVAVACVMIEWGIKKARAGFLFDLPASRTVKARESQNKPYAHG